MRFFVVAGLLMAVFLVCGCDDIVGNSNSSPDGIDLSNVVWLDADVSGWARTASLNASVSGDTLILDYDKASVWPTASTRARSGGPLNAAAWVIVNIDGTWYAATFEWMRTGGTTRQLDSVRGSGGHIPHAPLNRWRPVSGETYGFMVTTPARTADRTINERSNVSMVTWP